MDIPAAIRFLERQAWHPVRAQRAFDAYLADRTPRNLLLAEAATDFTLRGFQAVAYADIRHHVEGGGNTGDAWAQRKLSVAHQATAFMNEASQARKTAS